MRIPRIYTEQSLTPGSRVLLESESSHHLTQVLRLQRESKIRLFNGSGREFNACIMATEKRQVQLEVLSQSEKEREPQLAIQLGIGISKGERMDYAIQKSVELGVTTIIPLLTQRTAVHLPQKRWKKRHTHWSNKVISACEQSGRNRLPVVSAPISLTEWLPQLGEVTGILLDRDSPLRLNEMPYPGDQIKLLTGPEGGFSDDEILEAKQSGFVAVRLGPRTMRAETTPLAAITAIQVLWGDF